MLGGVLAAPARRPRGSGPGRPRRRRGGRGSRARATCRRRRPRRGRRSSAPPTELRPSSGAGGAIDVAARRARPRPAPPAPCRSAGGTGGPGSGRDPRARPGGRGGAPARPRARAGRAGASCCLQHRERVGLLDARVVGDLVVADERGVDDGDPLDDVAHQGGDVEVAHDHGDRAAHQRVEAAAVDVLLAAPFAGGARHAAPGARPRGRARACG